MPRPRFRRAAIVAAAVGSIGLAAGPIGAAAAPNHQPALHAPARIRGFDDSILSHSNSARSIYHAPRYEMNHKLWKVAHAWAKHLARTGVLEHNPKLATLLTLKCPAWTAIGENVGVIYGTGNANTLFQAYMHSPEHRANILDKSYRQVGIATVKVVSNGQTQEWDVMDFGNHC